MRWGAQAASLLFLAAFRKISVRSRAGLATRHTMLPATAGWQPELPRFIRLERRFSPVEQFHHCFRITRASEGMLRRDFVDAREIGAGKIDI